MGILVKKRQAGGSLFADPRYLKLNANIPNEQGQLGQRANLGGGRNETLDKSKVKTEGDDLEGLLPSDIQYYQLENAAINSEMNNGFNSNQHFDSTPAYEQLLKRKYNLESVLAPQMKSMSTEYGKSKSKFQTSEAGDAPAIINDNAIVRSRLDGSYTVIPKEELITNAKNYSLLNAQDILTARFNDPAFSGFTKLGQISNQLIDQAYGSKSYDKDFDINVDHAGYSKSKGGYIHTTTGEALDLDSFEFDPSSNLISKTVSKKSNLSGLRSVYSALKESGDTNMASYLKNKAIAYLYKGVNDGSIDPKKEDIPSLMDRSINTQLITKLKARLFQDQSEMDKKSGTGTGKGEGKDRKSTVLANAAAEMYMNQKHVEIKNINETNNPSAGSIMSSMPAAYINKGDGLLASGYGENIKTLDDKNASETNIKSVGNNTLINDIVGDETNITTYGGVPLKDISDGGLAHVKISPKANMHIMLAPCVMGSDGKWKVDFTNEFTSKMMLAIKDTYSQLNKEGVTQIDAANMDQHDIDKLQQKAKENLKKYIPDIKGAPTIRATIAFNTMYESKNSDIADNKDLGWDVDPDLIKDISGTSMWRMPTSHYAKETVAFVPISKSFWKAMLMQGTFSSAFETSIPADDYEGVITGTPIHDSDLIKNMATHIAEKEYENNNPSKKRNGGKLLSDDELIHLLFN